MLIDTFPFIRLWECKGHTLDEVRRMKEAEWREAGYPEDMVIGEALR